MAARAPEPVRRVAGPPWRAAAAAWSVPLAQFAAQNRAMAAALPAADLYYLHSQYHFPAVWWRGRAAPHAVRLRRPRPLLDPAAATGARCRSRDRVDLAGPGPRRAARPRAAPTRASPWATASREHAEARFGRRFNVVRNAHDMPAGRRRRPGHPHALGLGADAFLLAVAGQLQARHGASSRCCARSRSCPIASTSPSSARDYERVRRDGAASSASAIGCTSCRRSRRRRSSRCSRRPTSRRSRTTRARSASATRCRTASSSPSPRASRSSTRGRWRTCATLAERYERGMGDRPRERRVDRRRRASGCSTRPTSSPSCRARLRDGARRAVLARRGAGARAGRSPACSTDGSAADVCGLAGIVDPRGVDAARARRDGRRAGPPRARRRGLRRARRDEPPRACSRARRSTPRAGAASASGSATAG